MWKKLLAWILVTVILTGYGIQIVEAFDQKEKCADGGSDRKAGSKFPVCKSSCAYGCGFRAYPV